MSDVSQLYPLADDIADQMVNDLIEAAQNWQHEDVGTEGRDYWEQETDRLRIAVSSRLAAARQPGVTLEQAQESVRAAIKQHVWAVEGLGSVNRLIESTNAALAALPWTTTPGEDTDGQ